MSTCTTTATADRRKQFWSTQPNACGQQPGCVSDCGMPGLELVENTDDSATIATNEWVRGLVLNILGTNGRKPNRACGYRANAQGGHWSDSFRTDGFQAGTLVRDLPTTVSIRDSIAMARAQLQADLQKLVGMGIAQKVVVVTSYLGSNRMSATIEIIGPSGTTSTIGLTGQRNTNAWVWK